MLSREGNGEAAIAQIDAAIALGAKNHILYHTKGTILSRLALTEEGRDVAMRRMVQSEANFRTAIRMHKGDD